MCNIPFPKIIFHFGNGSHFHVLVNLEVYNRHLWFLLLLQAEHHRHGVLHGYRLATLFARVPFRHRADYANSFGIELRRDTTHHLGILDGAISVHYKLNDDTAFNLGFLGGYGISHILGKEHHAFVHAAGETWHFFHHLEDELFAVFILWSMNFGHLFHFFMGLTIKNSTFTIGSIPHNHHFFQVLHFFLHANDHRFRASLGHNDRLCLHTYVREHQHIAFVAVDGELAIDGQRAIAGTTHDDTHARKGISILLFHHLSGHLHLLFRRCCHIFSFIGFHN